MTDRQKSANISQLSAKQSGNKFSTLFLGRLFFRRAGRFFAKNIPDYCQGNNCQNKSYLGFYNNWIKIHSYSSCSSILTAKYKDNITRIMFTVNTKKFFATKITRNQATAKLEQTAENTFNCARVGSKAGFITSNNYFTTYSLISLNSFKTRGRISLN